ncbi:hypothetical protein V1264_024422 [Littorina saxatilis]|uniref:Uncharacterized protein n=2 Tax=Littorina saxatilis TaxID=31220 RepID=A0AAN9AME5_9CAEN
MGEPLRVYTHHDGASIQCTFCRRCVEKDCTQACFLFDKDLDEVIEQCTKAERKQHLDRFLRMVNALLNQGGGVIYIHSKPHLLAFWDEQIDNDLMELVPDDTLFDNNFERRVITGENHVIFRVKPGHRPCSTRDFHSKVSLNKGLTDPTHPQMRRLLKVDRQPPDNTDPPDQIVTPSALQQGAVIRFQENVYTQAKVVQQNKLSRVRAATPVTKLVNYWWNELKLPLYIAAFTKQRHGGSFFLGLREEKEETGMRWKLVPNTEGLAAVFGGDGDKGFWKDDKNEGLIHLTTEEHVPKREHKTGRFICEGVALPKRDHGQFERELKERIRGDLLGEVIGQDVNASPDLDAFVDIFFYPVLDAGHTNGHNSNAPGADKGILGLADPKDYPASGPHACIHAGQSGSPNTGAQSAISARQSGSPDQIYVVEARVKYFHGVCFQSKGGPEAYIFDCQQKPRRAERVEMSNWIQGQRCVALQA